MPRGELVEFERRNPDTGDWEEWMTLRSLQQNSGRTQEYQSSSQGRTASWVTFRFRWNPELAKVDTRTDGVRMRWRGTLYNVKSYDDYMFQHRTVDVEGASYE